MPEDALEATIRSVNGLVGLLKLVEQIDGVAKCRWPQVRDWITKPRNSCVHRGIEPTREEVVRAIKEAQTLLETYSPLPEFALNSSAGIRSGRVPDAILIRPLWEATGLPNTRTRSDRDVCHTREA